MAIYLSSHILRKGHTLSRTVGHGVQIESLRPEVFTVLPQGYVNVPSLWHNIVPIDLIWLDVDDIMLTGPAEQEVTRALEASSTHAFQRRGEKSSEDSEVCHVSNIFRGPVVWCVLRNPPKVKDK